MESRIKSARADSIASLRELVDHPQAENWLFCSLIQNIKM
jgi:hypothetical protein